MAQTHLHSAAYNWRLALRFDEAKRDWLTLEEAAERLQVSQCTVRKLLRGALLKGRQIVKYAPWMITQDAAALNFLPRVLTAKSEAPVSILS